MYTWSKFRWVTCKLLLSRPSEFCAQGCRTLCDVTRNLPRVVIYPEIESWYLQLHLHGLGQRIEPASFCFLIEMTEKRFRQKNSISSVYIIIQGVKPAAFLSWVVSTNSWLPTPHSMPKLFTLHFFKLWLFFCLFRRYFLTLHNLGSF